MSRPCKANHDGAQQVRAQISLLICMIKIRFHQVRATPFPCDHIPWSPSLSRRWYFRDPQPNAERFQGKYSEEVVIEVAVVIIFSAVGIVVETA